MRNPPRLSAGLLAALAAGPATAAEPGKTSSFQPLTIQDAYPASEGEFEAEAIFRWERSDEGDDLYEPRPRVKVGALPGLELSLAVPYRFGEASGTGEGEVEVGGLYQLTATRVCCPPWPLTPPSPFRWATGKVAKPTWPWR